jgi:dsRNA-specific ribonuclease
MIDGQQAGSGTGASKKAAEQNAAREALRSLGLPDGGA